MSLVADYSSGDDDERDASAVPPAPVSGPGSGIIVEAAPAVEVLQPEIKTVSVDTHIVEHNPTYEAMWSEAAVSTKGRCGLFRKAAVLAGTCEPFQAWGGCGCWPTFKQFRLCTRTLDLTRTLRPAGLHLGAGVTGR